MDKIREKDLEEIGMKIKEDRSDWSNKYSDHQNVTHYDFQSIYLHSTPCLHRDDVQDQLGS